MLSAASITGTLADDLDFAGQQTDGSTGLQYPCARYYDPETGTFLSRNPPRGQKEGVLVAWGLHLRR